MARKFKYRLIFLLLGFFILNGIVNAQGDYKNEAELIKKADQLFKKDDFINAFRPYSQLLSVYPKNPLYNFRFGVCLIFADKRDKEKPIKYLEFAKENLVKEPDVYYYLAYAYHLNYRFSEAIKSYNKYIEVGKAADISKFEVERKIEMCNNGISLLSNIRDLYVLEKKQVRKSDFYRAYRTDEFGGNFLSKPEELKTKLDKKKEDNNFVFFSNQNQVVYYASYGKKGETGKDIYRVSKLPGGKWTEPQRLNEVINSPYDEDFPYMSPDGKTLFFCSKGHNTMGGYDVFVSTFNPASFMWSIPVNVNFPINTPFDDILCVSDSVKGFAYFASDRISPEGQITVYKVGIDTRARESENLALAFKAEESGQKDDYLKTLQIIKDKANLDVNSTPELYSETISGISKTKVDSTNKEITVNESENRKLNKELENTVISNEKIIEDAFNQHKKVKEQIADLKTKRDIINKIGNERQNSAKAKLKEASDSEYNANVLRSQAKQDNKEAELAYEIAKDISKQIQVKEIEAEKVLDIAAEIQKSISANSPDSTMAMYDRLVNLVATGDTLPDLAETILNHQQKIIDYKKEKSIKHYNDAKVLETDIAKLKDELKQYKEEAEKIEDAELKGEYVTLIEDYEKEIVDKQKNVDTNYDLWKKNRNEADSIVEQTKSINSIIADVNQLTQEAQQAKTKEQTQTEVVAENQNTEQTTEQETQQAETKEQTQTEVVAETQNAEQTTEQETQQAETKEQTQTEVVAETQNAEQTTEQEIQQAETTEQTQTEVVAENQNTEQTTEQETQQATTKEQTQNEVIAENQNTEQTTENEIQQVETKEQTQTEVIAENQNAEQTTEQETQQAETKEQTQTEVVAENQNAEQTTEPETQQAETKEQTQTEVVAENQNTEQTTEPEIQQAETKEQTQTEVVAENQNTEQTTEKETQQAETKEKTQTEVIAENQNTEQTTEQETQQAETKEQTQTEVIAENQQKEKEAENVLIEEVTKTQITAEANQYIKAVEEKINDLTNQSKAALLIANENSKQAKEKLTEADKLIAKSEKTNNESKKEALIIQASKLEEEGQDAAKEAIAYFNVFKQLEKEIETRTDEIGTERQQVQQIEELVEADNVEAANQKLIEFNEAITEKSFLRPSSEIMKDERQHDVERKQNELATAENNISTILMEKDSLIAVAENIRNEANLTKSESEKSTLLKKADDVDNTINEKNEVLKIANENKNALKVEINAIQSEIAITSGVFAELEKPTVIQQATAQKIVTGKEITALEENINDYKAENVFVEPLPEEEIVATITEKTKTQVQNEQELKTETEVIVENQQETEIAEASNIDTNQIAQTENQQETEIAEASNIDTNQIAQTENQQETEISEASNIDTNQIAQIETPKPIDSKIVSTETKTAVVNEATSYVNVYDNVTHELSLLSKKAIVIASNKSELSNAKLEEAKNLTIGKNNVPESEIATINQRIEDLNEESVALAREAVTAYNISKQLEAKEAEVKTEKVVAFEKLEEIKRLLGENKLDEANIISNELKNTSEIANSGVNVRAIVEVESIQEANNKQAEADNVFAIAENLDNEAFNLEVKAKKIREEAETIRRVSKRKKLIAEAEQNESEALNKRQIAMSERNKGSLLQIEASALRTQIDYTTQYISQSESASETDLKENATDVSNIDIAKLESQISELESKNVYADTYKTQASEIAQKQEEEIAQTKVNQQNQTDIEKTARESQKEIVAENQKEVQQATESSKTEKEVIQISAIDKANIKAQYYTKSANLANAEIQILESRMANLNDENLKNEYLSKIEDLRNVGDSLENLASESRAEVNLLRITQNVTLTSSDELVNPDTYAKSLISEAVVKNNEAQTLRQSAETSENRNERNELIASAEKLEEEAKQNEIGAKEIEGISNQNKFLSNKVKIEQQKIEDPNNYKITLAKTEEQEADYYYEKAIEYRKSAKANIAVTSKKSLLDEANSFERIALSKQQKALEIYMKENPNAIVDENFIAQNTLTKETVKPIVTQEIALNENKNKEQLQTTKVENVTSENNEQIDKQTELVVNEEQETQQTEIEQQAQTKIVAETNEPEQETQTEVITETNEVEQQETQEEITEVPAKPINPIGVYLAQAGQAEERISAYSDSNPIPNNVELPSGLVYKVQIAAFRKEVSHDVFKGLAPISSEKAPNSDFIRYMAGIFADYNPAISARDEIRQNGYRDAFVVAYFNGVRITIARARQLIQSGEAFTSAELTTAINTISTANSLAEVAGTTGQLAENIPVETKVVGDLFYSVQVGVYNTPRTSQQLFGIENLFNDRLNNGYYRYFSGKYNTHNEAVPVRDNIRLRGVRDAFIVSFFNNNKISLAEASRIQGGGQPRNRTLELQTQEIASAVEETQPQQEQQSQVEEQEESNLPINFRIQIGAYKNEISAQQLNLFERITNVEIQYYKSTSGLIIYTVGNFDKYADALNFKNNIVAAGIAGAFITAFNGNNRIDLQRAIELQ
ncbi:MAG: hypothetical protein K9J13_13355 [Saprospiraceae bacterium]|nr:hypothetical protein [Saprospiraceae bacterium]